MARIVVYTHPMDKLFIWRASWPPVINGYLLCWGLRELVLRGHRFRIMREPRPVAADLAILHVDSTIVDPEYLTLKDHFQHSINFGAGDISKRRVSKSVLTQNDDWVGKVLVKSDLNFGGMVEARRNREAQEKGLPPPFPGVKAREGYDIYESIAEVPPDVWADKSLVVEKFLPEVDPDGFAIRTWVFMGDRWSCMRHVATGPIVKAHGIVKSSRIEPPEEMFAERDRLGFQYGKFDFVIHEGTPVLFDANRTPGAPDVPRPIRRKEARNLADGLERIMSGAK